MKNATRRAGGKRLVKGQLLASYRRLHASSTVHLAVPHALAPTQDERV